LLISEAVLLLFVCYLYLILNLNRRHLSQKNHQFK